MVLERLNNQGLQSWVEASLEHLNAKNLKAALAVFLLAKQVDDLSPKTLADYSDKVGRFVNFLILAGVDDAKSITINHVRLFLLTVQKTGVKPHTVKAYYNHARMFLNWLAVERHIPENPMAGMHPPKVPKYIINPFKPEHLRQFLEIYDDSTFLGARNKAVVLVFTDTGVRLAEMAAMRLSHIDFKRGVIRIFGKGSKERLVAFGKSAQKAMLKYLLIRGTGHDELWLSEERTPLKIRGVQMIIRRLRDLAHVTGVRVSPHTFRHTAATQMLSNGANLEQVQSLLGHSSIMQTRKYAATLNSEQAAAAHCRFSPVDRLKL